MTPKEKATTLIELFSTVKDARTQADEMEILSRYLSNSTHEQYWREVKHKLQIKRETPTCGKRVLPAVFFLGIKVVRYRIVKDDYSGYECQKWRLWYPFWCQMNFCNTHPTIERAIAFIENQEEVVLSS